MISLNDAVEAGIPRVCSPLWGGNAYVRLIVNGGRLAKLVAFDYAGGGHQVSMNGWPQAGQDFAFDGEGAVEAKWLPFTGKPSPFEV